MYLVLKANAYQAETRETVNKRLVNVYEIKPNEHVEYGFVDADAHNIVACAIVDGSNRYPTRYNRIETGEHMHPWGRNRCVAVVVRD